MIDYKLDNLLNEILHKELACWLRPKLETIYGQECWWSKGVLGKLSERQRRIVDQGNNYCLSELDLQALLVVCSRNFKDLTECCGVSWDLKTPLESIRDARNALSHRKGGKPIDSEDLLLYALNSKKVLTMLSSSPDIIGKANGVVNDIHSSNANKESGSVFLDDINSQLDSSGHQQKSKLEIDRGEELSQTTDEKYFESKVNGYLVKELAGKYTDIETFEERQRILEPALDPNRELRKGFNHFITAVMKCCEQGASGIWQLELIINEKGQNRHALLTVPDYLSQSAQAAADILRKIKSRENPPDLVINILNVVYENGGLFLPKDLNEVEEDYPLIVIQPSYLINVTSLTSFDYCPRNYLMNRYSIPESNQAMQRGSLVHSVFEFMLQHPGKREGLMEHCHSKMDKQLPELTMNGVSPKDHYNDVRLHLNALAKGLSKALNPDSFKNMYIERYMINPDLGIKGKIDALVQKANGCWQALELKTGKPWGAKAKLGDALQVCAYHLLLSQAEIEPLDPPCVIYTGNEAKRLKDGVRLQPETMVKEILFNAEKAIELINLRNELVRIDYTGELDFNTNDNKCKACVSQENAIHCINLHGLGMHGGDWHSEHLDHLIDDLLFPKKSKELFKSINSALLEEFQMIRTRHGQMLQGNIEGRISEGLCLEVKRLKAKQEDGQLILEYPFGNRTEFREGDPCLISDKEGPIRGNCIEVYISAINKTQAIVSLPHGVNELWFEPAYLDINAPDAAFERNFASLYTFLALSKTADCSLSSLNNFLTGETSAIRPNEVIPCEIEYVVPMPLPRQKRAVEIAKGLNDILLILGPPGTGKTYTLSLIVKELVKDGKTVAIATYTHRAAEEVLNKLTSIAPQVEVRKLGRIESASSKHRGKCLELFLERNEDESLCFSKEKILEDLSRRQDEIKKSLTSPCVYVGTTHAWLSGKFDALPKMMTNGEQSLFDYVIVDEASQIITPNLLGSLRLGEKWVLVGDHKQLPPIVIGDTTGVLEKTLFEQIADTKERHESILIQLDTQHRMPPALSDFIGRTFYDGNLYTAQACKVNKIMDKINHPRIMGDHCIALINVEQDEEFTNKQSMREAKWITNLVEELLESGWPLKDESKKPTVGIIAPYRAQVALLRRELEEVFQSHYESDFWNDVVDTVDRFQGDERDIIIISLCMHSNSKNIPRIYEDERRINVALSRAKMKLWIIGAIEEMEKIQVLKDFKLYAESNPETCSIVNVKGDNSNISNEMF